MIENSAVAAEVGTIGSPSLDTNHWATIYPPVYLLFQCLSFESPFIIVSDSQVNITTQLYLSKLVIVRSCFMTF